MHSAALILPPKHGCCHYFSPKVVHVPQRCNHFSCLRLQTSFFSNNGGFETGLLILVEAIPVCVVPQV